VSGEAKNKRIRAQSLSENTCDDLKKVNIKRIASEKLVLTLYDKKLYASL
jgi:hypothetical protein